MFKMVAIYQTPSGKTLTREKLVRSLLELEEKVRVMRAMGYVPLKIKVTLPETGETVSREKRKL